MEKIRVMIADHGETFREGLTKLLEDNPDIQVVATSSTGIETIRKAIELKPDIIILDKYISKSDFIEVSQRIKKVLPQTRIIINQPYKDPDPLSALDAEAHAYIDKDTPIEVIKRVIEHTYMGEAHIPPFMAVSILELLYQYGKRNGFKQPEQEADLTEREIEVLNLISVRGMTNREIASTLCITEGTVKGHLSRIMEKLHVHSRLRAALLAREKGIIPKEDR